MQTWPSNVPKYLPPDLKEFRNHLSSKKLKLALLLIFLNEHYFIADHNNYKQRNMPYYSAYVKKDNQLLMLFYHFLSEQYFLFSFSLKYYIIAQKYNIISENRKHFKLSTLPC